MINNRSFVRAFPRQRSCWPGGQTRLGSGYSVKTHGHLRPTRQAESSVSGEHRGGGLAAPLRTSPIDACADPSSLLNAATGRITSRQNQSGEHSFGSPRRSPQVSFWFSKAAEKFRAPPALEPQASGAAFNHAAGCPVNCSIRPASTPPYLNHPPPLTPAVKANSQPPGPVRSRTSRFAIGHAPGSFAL